MDKEINELRQDRELHESLQQQRASLRQQQSSLLEEQAIVAAYISQKQLEIKQLQQSLHQEMVASAALRDRVHEQGAARGAAPGTKEEPAPVAAVAPTTGPLALPAPVQEGGADAREGQEETTPDHVAAKGQAEAADDDSQAEALENALEAKRAKEKEILARLAN